MEDLFISEQGIENELEEIKNQEKILVDKILLFFKSIELFESHIEVIFFKIKQCKNIESAGNYFGLLDKIQAVLAKATLKNGIKICSRFDKFIYDFDNIEFYKKYYFEKIIKGEYHF